MTDRLARDADAARPVEAVVREILAVVPAGCTWLLPVHHDGVVADFRVAATSGQGNDIYGRGVDRVGGLLSDLYPSMVDGPLWQLYHEVLATGSPGRLADFRYAEKRAGVVADSQFDVYVDRVLDGLLVSWRRLDEDRRRLERTELLGSLGWAEYDLASGVSEWSPGMYRIFERDPALGPLSRAEQSAAMLPDDQMLGEAAWQTMDSGGSSDVTVRFQAAGSVKYLRILSGASRDAAGAPLKIHAVVQDVTARVDSRTAIEQLSDQLRTREITALAEHRLAGQLQNLIQPVPRDPLRLAGLEAMVTYLPAESAAQVGGDWYHAQTLPDGKVVLAVGDVAGHGLDAASGMAHLRFALVAWLAIDIRDPSVLLGHLNRLCVQLAITATAVVAVYDPTTRVLCWARAGHLAPLLSRAGETGSLDLPPGLLLGAGTDSAYPVRTPRLRPDDLVLFYTDGLVERRVPTEALLDRVAATLSAFTAAPGEQTLDRLRELLHHPNPDDDTCTLAVRVLP
ncbi:PP2C family protein-serine/threonine phosphatase [Micromonospora sp. WMMD710]|uniref:PP2C family protein-serine/threonine phosphatase n=1 Tax=Micromonospora sp. WMMD710 TaxID=3016085 RepID=UPI002417ADFA|nr:PP2C family protein-serine/threonine phosphatase [Micromonospora sp. WMMD710]MDG4757632.1 PP2C family protein-serine/threonine phosphatase [Micromonospora sp. WMMD710]